MATISAALPKHTQIVARYTKIGTKAEHCAICRHYETPNGCAKVTGWISPKGWCKYWMEKA